MSVLHEVHLLQLPVGLWAQVQEQTDGLMREFALITAGGQLAAHEVPHRLLDLLEDLAPRFTGNSSAQEELLRAAAEAGRLVVDDVVYAVPVEAADVALQLGALLDEADAYCAEGSHLLTLAATPEMVRFRRWQFMQFVHQVAGRPPVAWPDWPAVAAP